MSKQIKDFKIAMKGMEPKHKTYSIKFDLE